MPTPNTSSIAEAIQALPDPFPAVEITNYYKGITLDQQGQIVSINPEAATIKATQRRTFPSLEGRVHLRSTAFPGAISGTVHPVDYSRGIFQLTGLSYTEWRDRQAERVQPKAPTYVTMKYNRRLYRAFLEDICTDGLGILANHSIDLEGKLIAGIRLTLAFQLGSEFVFDSLRCLLVYRQKVGRQLIKLGLWISPTADQKYALQRFIVQRHDEILDELEQDSIRMGDMRGVEQLFF